MVELNFTVDWNHLRRVWELVICRWGCGRKEWTTLTPLVFNDTLKGKVYGLMKVSLRHWLTPPTLQDRPLYLLFRVGDGEITPTVRVDFNVEEKTFKVNRWDEIFLFANGLDKYLQSLRKVNGELVDIIVEFSKLDELPSVDGRRFRRAVKLFGDCDLFVARIEGKDYTMFTDGSRHLILPGSTVDFPIFHLPLFKKFIDEWKYRVVVGVNHHYIEVADGIFIVSPYSPEKVVLQTYKTIHEVKKEGVEIFVPARHYERLVKNLKKICGKQGNRLNGKLVLSLTDEGISFGVRLINQSGCEVKVDGEVKPQKEVSVELPAVHSLNWGKLLTVHRWWSKILYPFTKLKIVVPSEKGELPVLVGTTKGEFPCLVLERSGVGGIDFHTTVTI